MSSKINFEEETLDDEKCPAPKVKARRPKTPEKPKRRPTTPVKAKPKPVRREPEPEPETKEPESESEPDYDPDCYSDGEMSDDDEDKSPDPVGMANVEGSVQNIEKTKIGRPVELSKKIYFCMMSPDALEHLGVWELNRKIDLQHVAELKKWYLDTFSKHKEFEFTDPIHLAKCKFDMSKMFIVDGQHRVQALLEIYQEYLKYKGGPAINLFPVTVKEIDSQKELIEYFNRINQRMPIDHGALMTEKINEVVEQMGEFCTKKNIWRTNRPYQNKAKLVPFLREQQYCKTHSADEIMECIREANLELKKQVLAMDRVSSPGERKTAEQKAMDMAYYLGLDSSHKCLARIFKQRLAKEAKATQK